MRSTKDRVVICFGIAIFGIVGIVILLNAFLPGKYDGKAYAHKVDIEETVNSEGSTVYYPIYYFYVGDEEYRCTSKIGTGFRPDKSNNVVHYDSKNPTNCKSETGNLGPLIAGTISLGIAVLIAALFLKSQNRSISYDANGNIEEYNQEYDRKDIEQQLQSKENVEAIANYFSKIQLIIARLVLGFIIFILLIILLFDYIMVRQTIIAKDYIETTANYVDIKEQNEEDSFYIDYIYEFEDKKGNRQEIVVSGYEDEVPEPSIKIKYNEKNPQEYYEDSATYGVVGISFVVIKIIILMVLLTLFFNKNLLSKTHISISKG